MSYSNTITKNDLKNIIEQVSAIDGTDMTQAEIEAFVEGLDVSGINAVDYIVEQGTNYRKWNSGFAECWGTVTIGSNSAAQATYPIPLINIKSCVASCGYLSTGTYVAPTISVQPLATAVNFYARVSTSTVTNPHTVYWEIKGTWK